MKYYIIANNKELTQESIDKLELNGKNLLVLFNYLWPLRFQEVLDYENKICISRNFAPGYQKLDKDGRQVGFHRGYANIKQIHTDQELFKKIYFHSHPSHMSSVASRSYQKVIDSYDFDTDRLGALDKELANVRNRIGYPMNKNISTGIIAYEYFISTKRTHDDIILVGFNSKVAKKFHNPQWEKLYMLRQINMNRCKFIQCYGLMERIL